MKIATSFLAGLVLGAVIVYASTVRFQPREQVAQVTVYPVTCAGAVVDDGKRREGSITAANDPLIFRADPTAQQVRLVNKNTGVLSRLNDCEVFDSDTWYCEGSGPLARMHEGVYAHATRVSSGGGQEEMMYVSRWRWWLIRVEGWLW